MNNRFKEDLNLWMENVKEEKDLLEELEKIKGSEKEVEDRFYKDLEFGTAGMRGIIGAGTNRMNVFVVGKITQALCEFLKRKGEKCSVVISYDSRNKSKDFAQVCASVFSANGVKVYMFKKMAPVPLLSFAIRDLGCGYGVMITASHNSYEYNGYKLYGQDGSQVLEEDAKDIHKIFVGLDIFKDVKKISFSKALLRGEIKYLKEDIVERYYEKGIGCLINKKALKFKDFSVVYTPLNGSGKEYVSNILKKLCVENFSFVEEQKEVDFNFTTCRTPDPGNKDALSFGLRDCKIKKPDILIATDPDGDRVGVAVPLTKEKKDYVVLNGNEIAFLMFNYICEQRNRLNIFPSRPVAIRTNVSSRLVEFIGRDNGVEIRSVITGFKNIGEQILLLEKENREEDFIFAFEESNGYLLGSYVRDKDGVFAAVFLCEIAAFYKERGESILDVLDSVYKKYGYWLSYVESFVFSGQEGKEEMEKIMNNLRNSKIESIGDFKIEKIKDYSKQVEYDLKTKLEENLDSKKHNMLEYCLKDNNSLIIRLSGTEPKIKVYYTVFSKTKERAEKLKKELVLAFDLNKYKD